MPIVLSCIMYIIEQYCQHAKYSYFDPISFNNIVCIEGTYKLVQGNEECIECPVNSNSTLPGATSCDCFPGYYRSDNEDATVGCTG